MKIDFSRVKYSAFSFLSALTLSPWSILFVSPASANSDPAYCHQTPTEVNNKNRDRLGAIRGDRESALRYQATIKRHQKSLEECRQRSWLKNQALWIRLYPCDTKPGQLDEIFDRAIDRGYNQVYVAAFYTGKVLLPAGDNPTVWPSVLTTGATYNTDLLAMAIAKGRQRGLKVYAWLYSLSFGKNYEQTPDGIEGLAANGRGQTTSFPGDEGYLPSSTEDRLGTPVVFVDPHSESVRRDYNQMVAAIAKRKPDGILFDYIRFPKGRGAQSIVGDVRDLWIYNPETRRKLEALAQNGKGGELIRRYLEKGTITLQDLQDVDAQYPGAIPQWVTRRPLDNEANMSAADRLPWIQWDLWQLAVGYAAQGVVDFFRQASNTAQLAGVSTSGAVFFPEGNQALGNRGYDSRLQPWHQFPRDRQWHPMVYGTCGTSDCIEKQVQRVVNGAPAGTIVMPVLAGVWGQALQNRPSLEVQMAGIHRTSPQITSMSHFAYSWQEPESDLFRSQCRL